MNTDSGHLLEPEGFGDSTLRLTQAGGLGVPLGRGPAVDLFPLLFWPLPSEAGEECHLGFALLSAEPREQGDKALWLPSGSPGPEEL